MALIQSIFNFLARFPNKRSQFGGPVIISLLCLLVLFAPSTIIEALDYKRMAIENGDIWRLFTGNMLHTNSWHLLLNLVGVVLLWSLHGDYYKTSNYISMILVFSLGTTLGIHFFSPDIHDYVGLSGALHGLFVWGAINDIRHKYFSGWLLIAGILFKVVSEQMDGSSEMLSGLIEAQVAVDSHLYGMAAGFIFSAVYFAGRKSSGNE